MAIKKLDSVITVYVPSLGQGISSDNFASVVKVINRFFGSYNVCYYEGPNGTIPQSFEIYCKDHFKPVEKAGMILLLPFQSGLNYLKNGKIVFTDDKNLKPKQIQVAVLALSGSNSENTGSEPQEAETEQIFNLQEYFDTGNSSQMRCELVNFLKKHFAFCL